MPLIVCLAIPFETFANNLDEFVFSIYDFLPLTLTFGLLFALIFFNIFLFLPERAYKICTRIYLTLAIMFYLQGTFFTKGMNSLAGDSLGSSAPSNAYVIFNGILWLAVIALFIGISFFKDKKGIVSTITLVASLMILFTQVITPVSISISNSRVYTPSIERVASEDSMYDHKIATFENLTTISKNRNVFYFCIDRFDEYYAEEAYRNDPTLFDMLEGFTSYNDHVSLYGHTYPSIAYMLTNKRLDINSSRAEHLNNVYKDDNTMSHLANNGYMVNLYTERYYAFNDANDLPDYVSNIAVGDSYKVTNPAMLSLNMIRMSMYRCLPNFMKNITGNLATNSFNCWVNFVADNGYAEYTVEPDEVYKHVSNNEFKETDKNVFSFIHLQGIHGTNVEYNDGKIEQSRSTVKSIVKQVRENFKVVKEFISALKKAGVYKDATIIITGDHSAPVDDAVAPAASRLTALFVKPSGVGEGKLEFSSKQVAHENIWPTIFKSEGIAMPEDYGKSVSDIEEGVNQTREYIWHTYVPFSLDEYVYQINGSARKFENWELTKHTHLDKNIMG